MTGRFVQLHLLLSRHRGWVLLAFVLFVAAAVLMGRKLQLNEDFTDILPVSAPAVAEQVEALKHIRQAERLYLDLATATTNAGQLAAAADLLTAALRPIPQLAAVSGEIDSADVGAAYSELQAQLPWLLNSNDLRELEPRLAPAALASRLAWLKQAMSQPQGLIFKQVAQTDPAGLGDAVAARLRDLQAGAGGAQIVGGHITSADGCHVLVQATPAFRSSETGKSAALLAAVLLAAHSVETNFPAGAVKISVTGAHRDALDNAVLIQHDTAWTSALATLAIAALIVAACRRRWLALLALTPVLFGALGAITCFFLTGGLVSAIALGCGSMLIGVAVDYGIYVIYQLDDVLPVTRPELARVVAGLTPAVAFGALTTMAAFVVMFLSPVSGHRQLGLFGALGVGLAALFALFILPVFIPVAASSRSRSAGLPTQRDAEYDLQRAGSETGAPNSSSPSPAPLPLTALLRRFFDWRARHPRLVLPTLIVFTLCCAAGISRLQFDGNLARLDGITAATKLDEATVKAAWGKALSLTTIVVGGATREEALAKNEQVFAALEVLRAQRVVESFSSIAPLLPSARTRAVQAGAWRDFWTGERQSELRASLAAAAAKQGFRAGAFAPFLATLAAPPRPATDGASPALDRLTADFWSGREGRVYVTTLVKVADTEKFRQAHAAIKAAAPDALLLNQKALAEDITRVARQALPVFGALVAALNALLLFLLLGRLELMAVTLLPMAAGVFWTLGTLGLFGLPVDAANFVFVIFVIGVGGDYSLFLMLGELEPVRGLPERTASTGGAVAMCALTALLGTGVLVLSRHPALFSVGLTALLGISYSLLATLFLVPPAVRWLARRSLRPPAPGGPGPARLRRAVSRLYHLQGAYVSQFAYWKMRLDPLFCAVEKAAPARGQILDAGCGYGMLAHWLTLAAPERRVLGLDFDFDKIRVARATARANPRVEFAQADLLDGPAFPPCDGALLCDVLHYFPRERKAALLRKIFAALRPGGRLVIRDAMAKPGAAHHLVIRSEQTGVLLGQNKTRFGLHFEDEPTHLALLREAGFAELESRTESGLGSNRLLIARKLPDLLGD